MTTRSNTIRPIVAAGKMPLAAGCLCLAGRMAVAAKAVIPKIVAVVLAVVVVAVVLPVVVPPPKTP